MPASSTDTASSLRQYREAVAAAAVGEVVQQIEQNSRARHRLSRKQRQRLRRQRQRAREAAAAAAAVVAQQQPTLQQCRRQPQGQQQQQAPTQEHDARSAADSDAEAIRDNLHWTHALRQLHAACQPNTRLRKRLRIIVDA
jgi:hypothetical protein